MKNCKIQKPFRAQTTAQIITRLNGVGNTELK